MAKVKMGFVGSGYMGQLAHIANYAKLTEECEMVALAEGRPELAKKVAARYGIARVYPDHQAIAADKEIEAVAAIMGDPLHYPIAKDLLLAGKHVIIEKPIAVSSEEADELVALAEKKGLVFQVGYMKRHDNGVNLAKEHLTRFRQSKEHGELRFVRAWCWGGDWIFGHDAPIKTEEERPDYKLPGKGFPAFLTEEKRRFFGSLNNVQSHISNLLRYLLGEDFTPEYVSPITREGFVITAKTDSGALMVMEGGWLAAHRWYEGVQFHFAEAIVTVLPPPPLARETAAEVEIYAGKMRQTLTLHAQPSWAFLDQARHFLESVQGKAEPRSPAREAAKDLVFFEQVMRLLP